MDNSLAKQLKIDQEGINARVWLLSRPFYAQNLLEDSEKFRDRMEAPETVEPLPALKSTLAAMPAFARPEPPLAIDAQGCIYLQACNPDVDMIQLITPMVRLFHEKSGQYPAVIELCERRWIFGQLIGHFSAQDGTLIPYVLGSDDRYDVVCRSLPMRR